MKYKLLFIALLLGFTASAQPGNYLYRATRERLIASAADSTFHVPAGASVSLRGGGWPRAGALFVDTVGADTGFYYMGHNKFHRLLRSDEAVPGATNNTNAGSGFRWLLPGDQTIKSAINGYGIIWDSATAGSLKATADTGTLFPAVRATIPPLYNLYTNDSIISDPTDSVRRITLASGNKLFFRRGETGYPENFNIPPFTFTFKDTITSNTYYNHARHGFYTLRTSVFNPGAPTNRQYTHGSENAWNIQIGDTIRLNPTGGDAITANTTNFILTRSGATTGRAVAKLGTVMYDATASHISNFIVNGGGGGNWIRVRGPIAGSIAYLNAGSSLDTIDYWQAFASSGTGSAHKLKSIDFAAGFGGSPNTDTSYSFISPIELSRMYQAGDLMVGPNPGMPIPGLTLDGDGIPIIGQFNDPSAKLQVNSTTKGFLPPRMTEAQKNAIASPAAGLLVYQTDATAGYYYYNGSAWTAIGGASGGLFARGDSRNNTAAPMLFSGAAQDMTLDSLGFFQMNAAGSQFDMANGFSVNTNPGGAYSGFLSSDNVGNLTFTGRNLAADTIVQINMEAQTGDIEISTPGKLFLKVSGYAAANDGDILSLVDNATGEVEWISPGGGASNIYNTNGTLTGNRTLDGDGGLYDLEFRELGQFRIYSLASSPILQVNPSGVGVFIGDFTASANGTYLSIEDDIQSVNLVNVNSSGTFFKIAGYGSASNGDVLSLLDNTTGRIGWSTSGIVVGSTNITSGTDTYVLFQDGSAVGEDAGFTYNKTTDNLTAGAFIPSSSTAPSNGLYLPAANTLGFGINSAAEMRLTSTALSPVANGGLALGEATLGWSGASFSNGAILLFNNAYTITHSTGLLTFSAALTGTGQLTYTSIATAGNGTFQTASSGTTNSNFAAFGQSIGTSTDGKLTFGGAATVAARTWQAGVAIGLTANHSYATHIIGTGGGVTEASSGTHAVIAQEVIKTLAITNAAGATTDATGLYIEGAPTGITPTNPATALWVASGTARFGGAVVFESTARLFGYTVATLPAAGVAGRTAYVTDATAPVYLGALVGGGAVVTPVFDNGANWVSY